MTKFARRLSLIFAAGSLGGLVNSIALWLSGLFEITSAFGVNIAPKLTAPWLYPRLVWGGMWGILFLLPLSKRHFLWRGLILSLGPTIVQLFIVFPVKAGKGMMGMDLGTLTPFFVLVLNGIWGLTAAIWLRWTDR